MQFWIKAASALPYTDDVGERVVTTLLVMASGDLSPHIPTVAWDWLNKRPVLPRECVALLPATGERTVQKIQQLRDVKFIVSYLHIVWSEWHRLKGDGIWATRHLIREELGGISAVGYRTDLIQRLDYVLLRLDQGQGVLSAKGGYEELRRELLEVDEEAKDLTGTSSSRHPSFVY